LRLGEAGEDARRGPCGARQKNRAPGPVRRLREGTGRWRARYKTIRNRVSANYGTATKLTTPAVTRLTVGSQTCGVVRATIAGFSNLVKSTTAIKVGGLPAPFASSAIASPEFGLL
jgi:hypothetical protein